MTTEPVISENVKYLDDNNHERTIGLCRVTNISREDHEKMYPKMYNYHRVVPGDPRNADKIICDYKGTMRQIKIGKYAGLDPSDKSMYNFIATISQAIYQFPFYRNIMKLRNFDTNNQNIKFRQIIDVMHRLDNDASLDWTRINSIVNFFKGKKRLDIILNLISELNDVINVLHFVKTREKSSTGKLSEIINASQHDVSHKILIIVVYSDTDADAENLFYHGLIEDSENITLGSKNVEYTLRSCMSHDLIHSETLSYDFDMDQKLTDSECVYEFSDGNMTKKTHNRYTFSGANIFLYERVDNPEQYKKDLYPQIKEN